MSDLPKSTARAAMRAAFWNTMAANRQVARLRTFDMDDPYVRVQREADAQFLVVALWRLRMAATMCEGIEGVAAAIATFDRDLPDVKRMRNVLMHYDNYILERPPRSNKIPSSGEYVSARDVETLWTSPDVVSWLGTTYRLDDVERAGTQLYRQLLELTGFDGTE